MAFGENFKSWCRRAGGEIEERRIGGKRCDLESGRVVVEDSDRPNFDARIDIFLSSDNLQYEQGGDVKRLTFKKRGDLTTMEIGRGTANVETKITASTRTDVLQVKENPTLK